MPHANDKLLMYYCSIGNVKGVKHCIARRANVNYVSTETFTRGESPLTTVTSRCTDGCAAGQIVQMLLVAGANVNYARPRSEETVFWNIKSGPTSLFNAMVRDWTHIVKQLIDDGANVLIDHKYGGRVAKYARYFSPDHELIELLENETNKQLRAYRERAFLILRLSVARECGSFDACEIATFQT